MATAFSPTTPNEIPLPSSPALSSSSSFPLPSPAAKETEFSEPAPLPIASLDSIICQNNILLSRVTSRHHSELAQIQSLTTSLKAHNDAIDARRRTCSRLTQSRQQFRAGQQQQQQQQQERLFKDPKLNELTCRLLAAKNAAVGKDEGKWDRRAREMEQISELRDLVAEFWVWDRTVLQRRMRELAERDMSVEEEVGEDEEGVL
ncbi:MAG: hypothetical protein LQ341_007438 [Variospora aurantia]|nr:MAG: hypothetical protein LQ341_007438 [Variospora aurantia]